MALVEPLDPNHDHETKKLAEFFNETLGFCPNSVLTMQHRPAISKAFINLNKAVMANEGRVTSALKRMIAWVSSNAAGCRYCQAHTIGSAMKSGVREEQLNDVWNFENSVHFNEKEKAALRFGLAAGSVPNAVTPAHFDDLKKHFTETQIVELGGVVSIFGFLNRWNDSFGTPLEDHAAATAEKYLGKSGWVIGQHGE